MAAPDPECVEVRRLFRAPRERVFDAWTRPALIERWNARSGLVVPVAEVDLRVGGRYRLHLRSPDGALHRIAGVYRIVERPARLVYSWIPESDAVRSESVVSVEFHECADGTEVRLRHEQLPNANSQRRHAAGWEACLAQLERVLQQEELIDACPDIHTIG